MISYNGWTALKSFVHSSRWIGSDNQKRAKEFLNDEMIQRGSNMMGNGGAAFGIPKKFYSFFDDYRRNYIKFLNTAKHDVPSIAYTFLENKKYNPVMMDRGLLNHYFGLRCRKIKMFSDYTERFNKE